jgi:hypothetical protein
MSRLAVFLPLALVLATAACSDPSDTPGSTGAGGAAASGAGPGATGSGGIPFDPGGEVTTFDAGVGPITVDSGGEDTQCIVMNLGNEEGAFVRRFRASLNQGSHHMIVYRSDETVEDLTPAPCQGFSGLLEGDAPVFIAQNANAQLVFPKDDQGVPVGLEIQPAQMFRIEIHFINTTDAPLDVTGKIFADTVPLTANVVRSDLAFWGTNDFAGTGAIMGSDIPPNASADTGMKFQLALADTRSFALTTHQHHLGTRMRVWYADNADDTSRSPARALRPAARVPRERRLADEQQGPRLPLRVDQQHLGDDRLRRERQRRDVLPLALLLPVAGLQRLHQRLLHVNSSRGSAPS